MKSKKLFTAYDISVVGMMAAVIFAATFFLKIGPIPLPLGDPTMLKLANALCLLGALLFGGVRGGLAAGIGSALFDLTNPAYVRSAPFTLVFFFLMAFVCGSIAHSGSKNEISKPRCLTAAILGALTYSTLYLSKSIFSLVIVGSTMQAAIISCIPKMFATSANAIFAIIVSFLLEPICRKALARAGFQHTRHIKASEVH